MKCPHCTIEFHDAVGTSHLPSDVDGNYEIRSRKCPSCKRNIFHFVQYRVDPSPITGGSRVKESRTWENEVLIRPKIANRPPVPKDVTKEFSSDYDEACLVIADSPKASAALSRRCLQHIIRDKMGIKRNNLDQEIQEVINKGVLPTDILESIDAVRNIGNFAAHPIKSTSSGEIVEVEPHEAEWNLDVIEMLFEYLFVRPAAIQKKREALNLKLGDAGKKPLK